MAVDWWCSVALRFTVTLKLVRALALPMAAGECGSLLTLSDAASVSQRQR